MCGIFGGSARAGQQLNKLKLITLGMYNRDRGKDSCGYYYNGHIEKGAWVKYQEDYSDFMNLMTRDKSKLMSGNLECEVFMGHTRKSTGGAHTTENAHPFVIADNYVQTHNGKIENITALKDKYGIKEHITVDSKALATLINIHGFKILEEYVGYAALAMTFMHQPRSLYLFSGAARNNHNDTVSYFERPLFFIHQPEGIYYSSMPESLYSISTTNDEPLRLIHNKVLEIVDGEFTGWEFIVNREEMNLKPIYTSPAPVTNTTTPGTSNSSNETPLTVKFLPPSTFEDENVNDMVKKDKIPLEGYNADRVYVKHGRYYANYKLLEGLCCINKEGYIVEEPKTYDKTIDKRYFVKGIMMRSEWDYKKALEVDEGRPIEDEFNIALFLSPFSEYPVFNLEEEGSEVPICFKNKWYWCGRPENQKRNFTPKFGNKTYHISGAKTVEIKEREIKEA